MKELIVVVSEQQVHLLEDGRLIKSYPASTSKYGLGTEEGSNCTPLGRFYICEKYGRTAPLNTIFRGRRPEGIWNSEVDSEHDFILTRIFRLASDEETLSNTYQRYIYFHGTNQETLLGQPASHGCVRMGNQDIQELFSLVPVGTPVQIITHSPL